VIVADSSVSFMFVDVHDKCVLDVMYKHKDWFVDQDAEARASAS